MLTSASPRLHPPSDPAAQRWLDGLPSCEAAAVQLDDGDDAGTGSGQPSKRRKAAHPSFSHVSLTSSARRRRPSNSHRSALRSRNRWSTSSDGSSSSTSEHPTVSPAQEAPSRSPDLSSDTTCTNVAQIKMPRKSPRVVLILPQEDKAAATTPETAHESPTALLLRDTWILLKNLRLSRDVLRPFWTKDPSDELDLSFSNFPSLAWLSVLSTLSVIWVFVAVPASFLLPGAGGLLLVILSVVLLRIFCWPIQGPMTTESSPELLKSLGIEERGAHKHERWVFVNGIMVTGNGLQQNVDRLTMIFGRRIHGIHNQTLGLFGDLIECIVQRSFGYYTKDTRVAYEKVKAFCSDPTVKKVVLIGHSQGGIVVSNILDKLFTDLPRPNVSKLEVYTFGCAASHFNNPLREAADLPPQDQQPRTPAAWINEGLFPNPQKRVIPYVEHYANEDDLVTRWGVLYSVKNIMDNRFCGKVFLHTGTTGHLLNQHYLSQMFPLPPSEANRLLAQDELPNIGQVPFLEQTVLVDIGIERERRDNARKLLNDRRQNKTQTSTSGELDAVSASNSTTRNGVKKNGKNGKVGGSNVISSATRDLITGQGEDYHLPGDIDDNHTSHDITGTDDMHGDYKLHCTEKKVREVSRLSQYMGGKSPRD